MDYQQKLEKAGTIADIFDIVKEIVRESLGLEQAGLMVGISDLGSYSNGFIGAFYSLNSNMIIINKRPIGRLMQTNPALYKYYLFHVMLHEYVHSVGFMDEKQTRQIVFDISRYFFEENHIVTELAVNIERFIPHLVHPTQGFQEPKDINIEFVKGIDRKNINYIS